MSDKSKYNRARLDDRQVTELVGIARGLIADNSLNDMEIEYLYKWMAASKGATSNPLISTLFDRFDEVLADNIVDDEERAELFEALANLTGNNFEVGEALKSTTLPVCTPAPEITFDGLRFTFTGSCVFGSRKECEAAVNERGGTGGSLRQDTSFLVIGEYASDDWIQSSYGRKIEKAVAFRDRGLPISIVAEAYWREFL